MSLQDNLNMLNASLQKILKPNVDDIIEKHIESLTTDCFLNGVLQAGAQAPFSAFPISTVTMSSTDLLHKGPLVVCFTRGGWCPFCMKRRTA